jgi:hypothetical protein
MPNNEPFDRVNRILIQLALLVMLIIGLIRIVAPEVAELRRIFTSPEPPRERVEVPAEVQGQR